MTYNGTMQCVRCGKGIFRPNSINADYIMADDLIIKEPRGVLIALKHNQKTLAKKGKAPIDDSEYDAVEVPNIEAGRAIEGLVKVIAEIREKDVQKLGVICPDCYKKTDFVIWGIHKRQGKKMQPVGK